MAILQDDLTLLTSSKIEENYKIKINNQVSDRMFF